MNAIMINDVAQGLNPSLIQSAITRLALARMDGEAAAQEHIRSEYAARFDAFPQVAKLPEQRIAGLSGGKVKRGDAGESNGFFLARQLEYRYQQEFERPQEPLSAFNGYDGQPLFMLNREVPLGAKTHTVTREDQLGEATVWRGGQGIPQVGLARVEEQFPVRYVVAGFNLDIFELQSANFANVSLQTKFAARARDAVLRKMNALTWAGDSNSGIYGVLNYPWLPKKLVATSFSLSASADSMLAELQAVANFASDNSRGVTPSDTLAVSTRIYNIIAQKRLGTTTEGFVETVLSFFLKTHPTITKVVSVPELISAGPGGTDGMLAYHRSSMGIDNVIVADPTALPVQQMGLENINIMFGAYGGVVMRHASANTLGWVTIA